MDSISFPSPQINERNQTLIESESDREHQGRTVAIESVPEFIRPLLIEHAAQITRAYEKARQEKKRVVVDLHTLPYRYIAIAFRDDIPPHLQRELTGLMTSQLQGWTLQQGDKFTTLTKDSPNTISALDRFIAQANRILEENNLKGNSLPFWISIGKPQETATIRIAAIPSEGNERPKLFVYQALSVTPQGVLFPAATATAALHGNEFSSFEQQVQLGKALPILTQDEDDPTLLEKKSYKNTKKNATFDNIGIIATQSATNNPRVNPDSWDQWERTCTSHWDVFKEMTIGQSPYTLEEIAEEAHESPTDVRSLIIQSIRRHREGKRATQEISIDQRETIVNVDISGMTAITSAFEKEFNELFSTEQHHLSPQDQLKRQQKVIERRKQQTGITSLFREWLLDAVTSAHLRHMHPSELAGDGFVALANTAPDSILPPSLEFLDYIKTLSASWNQLVDDKMTSGTEVEKEAAQWIKENFGNRVFLKIAMARAQAKMSLIPAGTHARTVFMESDADVFSESVHKETKNLLPKVEKRDERSGESIDEFFLKNNIRIMGGVNEEFINRLQQEISFIHPSDTIPYGAIFRAIRIIRYPTEQETLYFVAEIPQNADRFVEQHLGERGAQVLELVKNGNMYELSALPFLTRQEGHAKRMELANEIKNSGTFSERISKNLQAAQEGLEIIRREYTSGVNIFEAASHAKVEEIVNSHIPTLTYNMYVQNEEHIGALLQDLFALKDGNGDSLFHPDDISFYSKKSMVDRKGQWDLNPQYEEDLPVENFNTHEQMTISGTREVCVAIRFPSNTDIQSDTQQRDQYTRMEQAIAAIIRRTSLLFPEDALRESWVVSDLRGNPLAQHILQEYQKPGDPTYFQTLLVFEKEVNGAFLSILVHPDSLNVQDRITALQQDGYVQHGTTAVIAELAEFIKEKPQEDVLS
ncbi:hypothetical protein C5B42_03005 [Candidatus Cerribacteria bacterium 'Amazon FNV 2010 28 9']|uniref:Uncharacterized protein n=1 Tax=Candidatus Cerribacteria bacterium 'Amazon FNV 2010 28 9' TaxID=2081795 RepID=A0A317JPB8_9BACT|nr:MAG: hypothetical protein C5B42_03005 [Candidatus Cerribacteria bacterium 'Amazon FNV 2010 28 9']